MSRATTTSGPSGPNAAPVQSAVLVWTARTLAPLVRLGVVVLISRRLGVAALGAYQIMVATLVAFETVAGLGLWPLLVRSVARRPEDGRRYLVHGGALTVAAGVLLVLPTYWSGIGYDDTVRRGLLVLAFTLAPSGLVLVAEAILIARGRPQAVALLRVAENAVLVAATAALVAAGDGLVAIAVAMVVCRVGCAAAALGWAFRACPPRRGHFDAGFARALLAEAPVFLALSVVWALYTRVDVLILSRLVGLDEVGLYGAAARVLAMAQEVPQSILTVVLPMLAAGHAQDRAAFRDAQRRTARYFLVFALPLAVGATVLGARLLPLVFGAGFERAATPLAILMWSFVPFSWMKLLGSALMASDRQSADLTINVVVLLVTAGALVGLVPGGGATGAAWAVLLGVGVAVALRQAWLAAGGDAAWPDRRSGAVVLAGAVMAVVLVGLRGSVLALPLVLGPASYVAALLAFGAFAPDELGALPGRRGRRAVLGRLARTPEPPR